MNEVEALEILRLALWTVVEACAPAIVAAMLVGVIIALLQALTQIQEMTLTFIPKIVVMLIVLSISATFMGSTLHRFADRVFTHIEHGF